MKSTRKALVKRGDKVVVVDVDYKMQKGGEPIEMSKPDYKRNKFVQTVKNFGEANFLQSLFKEAHSEFMQDGGGYIGVDENYINDYDQFKSKGQPDQAITNAVMGFANNVGTGISKASEIAKFAAMFQVGGVKKASEIAKFAGMGGGSVWDWTLNGSQAPLAPQPTNFNISSAPTTPDKTPLKFKKAKGLDLNNPNYDPFEGGDDVTQPTNNLTPNPYNQKELDWTPQSNVQSPYSGNNSFVPMGPTIASVIEAMGNKGKSKKSQAKMYDMMAGDNVFSAKKSQFEDRGDYTNNNGYFRPDQMIPMGYNSSEFAKFGKELQKGKFGLQKENPYTTFPTATPESVIYGKPEPEISNTLSAVKPEHANLEAEVGETVMTPAGLDGIPKFFKVAGKNHSDGGTPLNLPEKSFIFSKTKSMKIRDKELLKSMGFGEKPLTPAEMSKRFDYTEHLKTIQDPNANKYERETAELMIQNSVNKLGQIAIAQEAKKGFPNGIPQIAVPYLESIGVMPEDILPQSQQASAEGSGSDFMKMGGNIMGGPVIPSFQTGAEMNTAQKVFSGKNPITNQKKIEAKGKAYMPEAWGLYAKANLSRYPAEIRKVAKYMADIDSPGLGWMPWQTEQDTFENAAGTLFERADMLERDKKKAIETSRRIEENKALANFRNQLMEYKKTIPNTPDNIDKISMINEALDYTSRFSYSKGTYGDPMSLIQKYSDLLPKAKPTVTPIPNKAPVAGTPKTLKRNNQPTIKQSAPKPKTIEAIDADINDFE